MANKVVSIEDIEAAREKRLGTYWQGTVGLMQPGCAKGKKLGKRPISREGTLNSDIIRRSPGSRIPAVDFVKAVYADRTGQE